MTEVETEDYEGDAGGTPVCPYCHRPVRFAGRFCEYCGKDMGVFSPVHGWCMGDFYARIWLGIFDRSLAPWMRVLCVLLSGLFWPVVAIGLPFRLWERLRKNKGGAE